MKIVLSLYLLGELVTIAIINNCANNDNNEMMLHQSNVNYTTC